MTGDIVPLPASFSPTTASSQARTSQADSLAPLSTERDLGHSAQTPPTTTATLLTTQPPLTADMPEDQPAELLEPLPPVGLDFEIDDESGAKAATPPPEEDLPEGLQAHIQDPVLRNLLTVLSTREPEDKDPQDETALSSPVTEPPELPNQEYQESEPPASPRHSSPPRPPASPPRPPASLPRPPASLPRPPPSLPAESSATAAKRARAESSTSSGRSNGSGPSQKRQKASDNNQSPKVEQPTPNDNLESVNIDSVRPVKEEPLKEISPTRDTSEEGERRKYKRVKGPDGKLIRTSLKSRKRLDQVIGRTGDAPEKIAPRAKTFNEAQLKLFLKGKTREVQVAPCMRPRYAKWGKCTQCVSKLGGDSCRFRDYRVFTIDPETTEILGPGCFESTEWKEPLTQLPRVFNIPMTEEHMKRIERTVAPLLLPLITREVRHAINNKAIKRETDTAKHRAVCDFCSSTIFAGWFFCRKCGRDYCLVCERYFADSYETMGESPWKIPDAARPRLLRCIVRPPIPGETTHVHGGKAFHFRPDLQPVSRLSDEQLKEHWMFLAGFVLHADQNTHERLKLLGLGDAGEDIVDEMQSWATKLPSPPPAPLPVVPDDQVRKLYTKRTHPTATIPDPAGLEDQSHEFMYIPTDKLDHEVFDQLWGKGEPIVVDRVADALKMSWTPDDFIERFGDQKCFVVDCETDQYTEIPIRNFFTSFKDRENRPEGVLKLGDWPTADHFADTHPELYNDFCDALPAPNFTRRDGVLNLYSHFPPGPTKPDIGPKMYNAFEAAETPGGHGSTRLHMDVADAVNVMLYASDRKDGQPGCAVWDLFRAEDADQIRLFLKRKFDKTHEFTDPIHSQQFYLDSDLRKELYQLHGVVSWRVYQYTGQAVFIPAGCAHQVCNLADCIKIALDFVSDHNVSRCQQLSQDFRSENIFRAWKDDVLQLYNVLWYSWTNVRETRERRAQEAIAEDKEAEARKARLESLQNGQHVSPGYHLLGDRHRGSLLSPVVSSVRDEENTRSPTGSRSSTPNGLSDESPKDDTAREGSTADVTGTTTTGNAVQGREASPLGGTNVDGGEQGQENQAELGLADKLFVAMLSASESAPQEARAPSAASGYTARGTKMTGVRMVAKAPASGDKLSGSRAPGIRGRPVKAKVSSTQPATYDGNGSYKGVPIDFMVNAARLAMGEGADEGEGEVEVAAAGEEAEGGVNGDGVGGVLGGNFGELTSREPVEAEGPSPETLASHLGP